MQEEHLHFSGALSEALIRSSTNYENFFKLYEESKKSLIASRSHDLDQLYKDGIVKIISNYHALGVRQIKLIVRVQNTVEATEHRISVIREGQNNSDHESEILLRLAIHREDPKNSISQQLCVLKEIVKSEIASDVYGLDVVGRERGKSDLTIQILEEINEMDGQDKFESVSAHFGEAPNGNSTLKLEQLRTILKKGLANRIGHCAALWCVNSSTFAEKIELVRVIKELQTVIEICPSSTSILFKSPTIDREIINLLGTSIVIGSDNPGLFNTDLRNEIRIFESFLSSPKSESVFEI